MFLLMRRQLWSTRISLCGCFSLGFRCFTLARLLHCYFISHGILFIAWCWIVLLCLVCFEFLEVHLFGRRERQDKETCLGEFFFFFTEILEDRLFGMIVSGASVFFTCVMQVTDSFASYHLLLETLKLIKLLYKLLVQVASTYRFFLCLIHMQ
jgi:hypothetical protein